MKFNQVARVFDAIEQESSRTAITKLLADLFKQATPTDAATIAYLSLGSLNPPYIATQFNFAEKGLIKTMALVLDTTVHAVQAAVHKHGDVGLVLAHASWAGGSDILSVHDVQKALHQFIDLSGTGSQEHKEQYLVKLLRALDPLSAKYIVRIIAGQLRLGFSDMTMLDAFSWMATGDKSIRKDIEEAYNICADIGFIIKTLKTDGIEGIRKVNIVPGIPILPAAAERLSSAGAIIERLGRCAAQPKLDGFRLQIHIDKTKHPHVVRFFSRNLLDMSPMFPDLAKSLEDLDVHNVVADGEAICVDIQTGSFLPFQETVKRKRKYDIEKMSQDFPLKLYLFDILYLNGTSLLDQTHEHRRAQLLKICDDAAIKKHQMIFPIEEEIFDKAGPLEAYFQQNIALGLEGLVVKRMDAPYKAGKRNFNWIKLKRVETGTLDDTIDCVILGYYFGQGKRASFGIGALLVGVYNKHDDTFQTVAKIGTGLTDEEWREQKKMCEHNKVDHKPHNVDCANPLYPDVWTYPTTVCQVRADEITRSPLHRAGITEKTLGFALRFPRLMGYRPDKKPTEATTTDELKELFALQFAKRGKGEQK